MLTVLPLSFGCTVCVTRQIHQEYLKKRYVVSCCTCGCLLYTISLIALVLLPLVIGFGSHSFWLKEKLLYDLPDVTFQNRMVVLLEGRTTSSQPFQYLWTTSPTLNDLINSDNYVVPTVKARSHDENNDGYVDSIKLSLSLPLTTEGVQRVAIVSFLQYKLHGDAKLSMDALAIVDASTGMPAASLSIAGDVKLAQREPLRVTNSYLEPYTKVPLWDESLGFDAIQLSSIVDRYMQRNFTTTFDYQYPLWTTDLGFGSSAASPASRSFDAAVTINVPSNMVHIIPATSEMIKVAWIQYLSILVVIWVIIRWARIFLFGQKLVASTAITDIAGKEHKY